MNHQQSFVRKMFSFKFTISRCVCIAIFPTVDTFECSPLQKIFCNLALKSKRKFNGQDQNWFSICLLIAEEFAFLRS